EAAPVNLFGITRSADDGEREHTRAGGPRAAAGLLTPPTLAPAPPPSPPPSDRGTLPVPKRFLLWVDGVGGYLVCPAPRVTFGLATPEGPVDVPLYADVSRLHAEISRDGEGYVIESGKGVLVNGKEVSRAVLAAGDRL